jgi:hypothetical protein
MAEERPRFRRDLVAKPVELEGVAYVETIDPRTGQAFRFYEVEHAVAEAFDGRPLPEVVSGVRERSGLELTLEQLAEFARRLTELGFLEKDAGEDSAPNPDATRTDDELEVIPSGEVVPETLLAAPRRPASDELETIPSVEVVPETLLAAPALPLAPVAEAPTSLAGPSDDLEPLTSAEVRAVIEDEPSPGTTAEVMAVDVMSSMEEAPNAMGPGAAPPAAAPPAGQDLGSSPPPIGMPSRPLTEETAMPPVLPPGFTSHGPANTPRPAPPLSIPPLLTPKPVPPPAPVPYRPAFLYAGLGIGAAVIMGFVAYRLLSGGESTAPTVHTIVPAPQSIFRYYDAVGTVKLSGEKTLVFPTGGKVAQIQPAGTTFKDGDVLAELESARRWKAQIDHHRERLAFYETALENARLNDKKNDERQAELKVAEKKRLLADAQAGYARESVIASGTGEIAEALLAVGATVKAGTAAARTKGTDWRVEMELSREDAERLRHLGFCHAEIDGKAVDCHLTAEGGDETHVLVDLPADPSVSAGKPVRLARARYDGVFVLPTSALVPSTGTDRRVFVVKGGLAESYAVVLVDQTPTDIIVGQGLEEGSPVVIDAPPDLRSRTRVTAMPARN